MPLLILGLAVREVKNRCQGPLSGNEERKSPSGMVTGLPARDYGGGGGHCAAAGLQVPYDQAAFVGALRKREGNGEGKALSREVGRFSFISLERHDVLFFIENDADDLHFSAQQIPDFFDGNIGGQAQVTFSIGRVWQDSEREADRRLEERLFAQGQVHKVQRPFEIAVLCERLGGG